MAVIMSCQQLLYVKPAAVVSTCTGSPVPTVSSFQADLRGQGGYAPSPELGPQQLLREVVWRP